MMCFVPRGSRRVIRRYSILAACVAAAVALGCQKAEPPTSDDAKPSETIATPSDAKTAEIKPAQTKSAESKPLETKPSQVKPAATKPAETKSEGLRMLSGRNVLARMIEAYQKAKTYADAGSLHFLIEAKGRKVIDETVHLSLTLERPNRIRLEAYQSILVSDGQKLFASLDNLPDQVVVRTAPKELTLKNLFFDPNLANSIARGIAGPPPQLLFLFSDDPLNALLGGADEPTLEEPGEIDGRKYHRVQIKRAEGAASLWIDQETFVLRRLLLPTDMIRQEIIQQEGSVDRILLAAEFPGAQFNSKIDPKAFRFETPKGAEINKFFIPPDPAQLLGKKMPNFKFQDLDGKTVTQESLAGKVAVLDFWATYCGPCKQSLPEVEKVYQKFKDNPKVAFYAVSVDQPDVQNTDLVKIFEELKVKIPMLRNTDRSAMAFRFEGIPATFLIDGKGVVQDCKMGGDPKKIVDELSEKLKKLLSGENIYEEPLKEYQDRVKKYFDRLESKLTSGPEVEAPAAIESQPPKVAPAAHSEPAKLKLTLLWKSNDVKAPGNVLAIKDKNGAARILAIENWNSIAELGLDGKLVAMHKLKIEEEEIIGNLRTAVGDDEKRYFVAFMIAQQRCHVLDENLKLTASYPKDALKNRHSGIVDVQLGDLDGLGRLKLYLSYLGVVGVQAASLEGERLWANRSVSNVFGLALRHMDSGIRYELICSNSDGPMSLLDAEGQRKGELAVGDRKILWLASADLHGDGKMLWCGISNKKPGDNLAVGFFRDGKEFWSYQLPKGIHPQPIEQIIPGKLTRGKTGQWILPGPDGSIHILSPDGKLLDKFNYGVELDGLATTELNGQPILVISSVHGLEAWKVEGDFAK
jgi:thiol-disulfide isomerase/thioredoxin/outer membrane lipoprotein-sorting protein